jgi:hypothetical protein
MLHQTSHIFPILLTMETLGEKLHIFFEFQKQRNNV